VRFSDEEVECLVQETQAIDEMLSSHEEMISSACSLELTTSTSDGLSDKENIVRLLKHHVSSSNRLSNSVRLLTPVINILNFLLSQFWKHCWSQLWFY